MKNRKLIAPALVVLAACGALIMSSIQKEDAKRTIAIKPEAPYDQLPPTPSPEDSPKINGSRLRQLAEAKDYKGPSFREDYRTEEVMMAARKRHQDRLPAAHDAPAKPRKPAPNSQDSK